jgi:hypothetical protein
MKTITKKPLYKKPAVIVALIAIALLVIGAVAYAMQPEKIQQVLSPATTDTSDSVTPSDSEDTQSPPSEASKEQEVKVDTSTPSTQGTLTITRLEQSGSTVHAEADIKNAQTGGTCTVRFTSEYDKPVYANGTVTKQSDTSHLCSASISTQSFSYLGEWQVVISYVDTANTKLTATGTITIQ